MNSKKIVVAGLPMIAVAYGLSRFSYGLMLPYINETIQMNQSTIGLISSLSYVAYCIAIIFAMICSNKLTPKSILIICGFSSIIGLGTISISYSPVTLGFGIFVAGLSTGLASPPYADIVSTNVETKLQNQTNSWINCGTSIGTAFTGVISIIMTNNWRETYLMYMIIAVFVLIINYKILPHHKVPKKKFSIGYAKNEWKRATQLVVASLLIGISSSAYWTFSRDFMMSLDNVSPYLGEWFWIIIGISGLLGGTAGAFINKFGLISGYRISILALSSASFILGIDPINNITGFISPIFFGSSYIFMTTVLLVWGISIFKTSPSFGLGAPFLILAFGQTIGSIFSGQIAGILGYYTLFILYAIVGYATLVLKPKV